jgi:hypothetical protein
MFGGMGAYALVLLGVGQLGFVMGFGTGLGLPSGLARTGTYQGDLRLPGVAAVDPYQMARAVAEAGGGSPTIAGVGVPPIAAEHPAQTGALPVAITPQLASSATASTSTSATAAPAHTGTTQVSTLSIASGVASIPQTLQFPASGQPPKRRPAR